jgi:hypothetical protein
MSYFIEVLICITSIPFAFGFAIGFFIKNGYRYRLKTNQNPGEASVYNIIKNNFPAPQYHLSNNITIPFQDGTTQIDHILVSTKRIFVIDEKSKEWTQVLYRVKKQISKSNSSKLSSHQSYRRVIQFYS